jgi:hypothetical protein
MVANPSVAIKFENIAHGQPIHVECRLWYKGVVHNKIERSGMLKFDILGSILQNPFRPKQNSDYYFLFKFWTKFHQNQLIQIRPWQ